MWKTIYKGSLLIFILSVFICSSGNNYSLPGVVQTTELVEIVNLDQTNFFPLSYLVIIPKDITIGFTTFQLKIFQHNQDQKILRKYLKQEEIVFLQSYIPPLFRAISFSVKEPLPALS